MRSLISSRRLTVQIAAVLAVAFVIASSADEAAPDTHTHAHGHGAGRVGYGRDRSLGNAGAERRVCKR